MQNYDGDDWGAPESEDEDDSPVAAPPPVSRPMGGPRLPSESRVAGAGRSVSGHGPAQVPTAQPPIEESVPAVSAPKDSVVPPQPEPVQTEPVLPATTSAELQHQEDIQSPTQVPISSGEFEADRKRMSVSPQLPNVARMSGFGVDFFSPGAEPSAIHEPTVQEEREPTPVAKEPFSAPTATKDEPTVSATTFAPPPAEPSAPEPVKSEAPQPAQPVPRRPSLPGQYVTEDPTHEMIPTPLSPPVHVNEPEGSPVSDNAPKLAEPSAGGSTPDSKQLRASADAKSLPPLRTPSPHEPRTVPPPAEEHAAAAEALMDSPEKPQPEITPTEPLQPKSATNYTPSDYEAQPLSRQFTQDTTTSSPVKESDVLSEEIMRTLTPGGLTSPSENPDNKRKSSLQTGRESTYTLSGYDDYWADSADKGKSDAPGRLEDVPEVPPVPASAGGPAQPGTAPEPAVTSSEPIVSPSSESQASLRRRFSWEAAEESQPAEPAAPVAAAAAAQQPAHPATATAPETSKTEESERKGIPGASSPASPTINIVSETPSISHQVSQASSKPATQPTPEPPSPVSELSDRDATPLAQPMVSPDNDTGLPMASPLSSNPVSSQNEVRSPKIASPTPMSPGKSIVTFREIMDMPTPKDRIAKYKETQGLFASQDSGLENWITTMKDEYPEHARANSSFSGTPAPVPPSSAGGAPGPGQQAPADQPYYQQYLQANANAPNASNSGSARSRIVGYSSQAQAAAGSAFGDGGKQIGTKGKEFMHSAGKMGKGLFSKGKSKLQQAREAREARGEKVFH